jgi:flagellar protein FlaG
MENNYNLDTGAVGAHALKTKRDNDVKSELLINQARMAEVKKDLDKTDFQEKFNEKRVDTGNYLEQVREQLRDISTSLNEDKVIRSKNLKFSVDEITNRFLVTVSDKETGEIIKQIPPEVILKVAHNLEALKGLLFDDKY